MGMSSGVPLPAQAVDRRIARCRREGNNDQNFSTYDGWTECLVPCPVAIILLH
jgi:hypothetical protein